jgi:hypothetical protein
MQVHNKEETTYLSDWDKEAIPTAPAITSKKIKILPSTNAPANTELQKFPLWRASIPSSQ